ncbi:MAG TPA: hypothetical protein PLV42_04230 [bacterium]|nr:hypothetical protein [bacterium]
MSAEEKHSIEYLKETLIHAAEDIRAYRERGKYLDEGELGYCRLWRISEMADLIDFESTEWRFFFSEFDWLIKTELTDTDGGMPWLLDLLLDGRERFPDAEKHWWWWLPEKVMTEEQRRQWDELLKKYPEI